jgi:hypothetical protein
MIVVCYVLLIFTLRSESEFAALGPLPVIVEEASRELIDEKDSDDGIANDGDFVIEHPTFITTPNIYKTEIPDYYSNCFYKYVETHSIFSLTDFRERHFNWLSCTTESVISVISVLKNPLLLENGTRRFEGLSYGAPGIVANELSWILISRLPVVLS